MAARGLDGRAAALDAGQSDADVQEQRICTNFQAAVSCESESPAHQGQGDQFHKSHLEGDTEKTPSRSSSCSSLSSPPVHRAKR